MAEDAPVNVVREDPFVRGLLYAGTEREVYVSFDSGGSWQVLTANLPHSSVRDLVVHGDDLAVATHGRGFWILDNVTPLREVAREQREAIAGGPQPAARSFAFRPQIAYRLRRDTNTDTPLPPEVPAGRNRREGADIDYFLAADASGPVTLEILTATGRLVRRYSSGDMEETLNDEDYNVPMYWARRPRALATTRGMHRFVWDLRYPAPGAVERDFPISAIVHDTPLEPLGVLATPGEYSVRLTVDGRTSIRPLTLKMDPRARITPPGLARQFALGTRIAGMMNRTEAAYRSAVEAHQSDRAGKLRSLNMDLATAYEVVEGADRAPTTQAGRAVAALQRRLTALLPPPATR
jgi:hypothetical protein